MKIKPLRDKILVKRIEEETKSAGGIIIPDTAKEKPQRGEIIAVGPGKISSKGELIQPAVKPGDKVLFAKWAGTEIKIEGQEYLITDETELLAVLE